MAILSYFTRFTMKRGNAGSWNSGLERSKYYRPILHNSKSPETPWKSVLEYIKNIGRRKGERGPPTIHEGGASHTPLGAPPCLMVPLAGLQCPSLAI